MDSKKQRTRDERKTLKKAQEVHYLSDFKAADRAIERLKENRN